MAAKRVRARSVRWMERELLEQLLFGTGRAPRFTQDSPVLPDVWFEYGMRPRAPGRRSAATTPDDPFPAVKLLLTPYKEAAAGRVCRAVRERIEIERKHPAWRAFGHPPSPMPRVIYNQSSVAATLYFEDLVRVVLPMTRWWYLMTKRWEVGDLQDAVVKKRLAEALEDPERTRVGVEPGQQARLSPDALWLIRVVGALAAIRRGRSLSREFLDRRYGVDYATARDWQILVETVAELVKDVEPHPDEPLIYAVSLNREASLTVARSTLAIKADAARRLFHISCAELSWGIIDSGIDAQHPAFRLRDLTSENEPPVSSKAFEKKDGVWVNNTRVVGTYDFTEIEALLDPSDEEVPAKLRKRLQDEARTRKKATREATLAMHMKDFKQALKFGRALDWSLLEPLLKVPHDGDYPPPGNDHGTHVAGILAGDWRKTEAGVAEGDLTGVCPDLRLYDFRVLNKEGRGDEFAVMAALQFARYLNSTNEFVVVHGVNLSLSIPHDISNYACGRTPVCDECERVVAAGIVVVAAAGNQGFRKYTTSEGIVEAYSSISITDPGNAETVITVGATHRYRPHTYGVSFFSSRGPTGDGRIKPDLVAPGEKIIAPVLDGAFGPKDGTSMAAPHVSGAAALLMARYNELVGRPMRLKQILCSTATDLGRERYFQGAGMLDVLRALQSV